MTGRKSTPTRVITGMRIAPDLLAQLDQYRAEHRLRPTRTLVMETAIREFLERECVSIPAEQLHASRG